MSNPSKLTPRRHPSANTPPTLEYDSSNAPVLIRLPDLSVSHTAAPESPDPTEAANPSNPTEYAGSPPDSAPAAGRRRRIDRSHSSRRRHRQLSVPSLDKIPKSRIAIAALVLAAAGITYFLAPSGQDPADSSSEADRWATGTAAEGTTADVQVVMPSTTDSNLDLWPEKSEAAAPQTAYSLDPSDGFAAQPSLAQDRPAAGPDTGNAWPDESHEVSLAAPSGHATAVQSDSFDTVAPAAGEVPSRVPAQPVSNRGSWPDASDSTSSTPTDVRGRTFYPEGPTDRTSRLQTTTAAGRSATPAPSGARLDGTIHYPHPSGGSETRFR